MKYTILKRLGLISSTPKDKTFYFIKNLIRKNPGDLDLYKLAFTHKSTVTNKDVAPLSYERLEFLGDAILDAIISDILYQRFESKSEGELTRYRSNVVKRTSLNHIAMSLGFKNVLIADPHANISIRIYGDMFEAFIGALYLDKGYQFTFHFVQNRVIDVLLSNDDFVKENNYKSRLLEWGQQYRKHVSFVEERSDENGEVFHAIVYVNNNKISEGEGRTKKESHNNAARLALNTLNQ